MKRLSITAATALALVSTVQCASAQVHFAPGGGGAGGGGGYPAQPLVVVPYASGAGNYGQQQPQVPQPLPPDVIEQQEDMQGQQAPSMMASDPDDSNLSQPPMDDPQDASGFDGLQSIDNVDSSY